MNRTIYINSDTDLTFENNETATLIIQKSGVSINYVFKNGNFKVLVFNDVKGPADLCETGTVINSEVEVNYIEVDGFDFSQKTQFSVKEGSTLTINSTYLACEKKYVHYDLFNDEKNSNVYINNNVVAIDGSDMEMIVEGNILKGSKNSICKQKNKCLTMGEPKRAKIFPILNIDENDVMAAHSLSCGTIDDESMFYLNSRGLTKKESLQLIVEGYLLPKKEFYDQFENGSYVMSECEGRVNRLCSM